MLAVGRRQVGFRQGKTPFAGGVGLGRLGEGADRDLDRAVGLGCAGDRRAGRLFCRVDIIVAAAGRLDQRSRRWLAVDGHRAGGGGRGVAGVVDVDDRQRHPGGRGRDGRARQLDLPLAVGTHRTLEGLRAEVDPDQAVGLALAGQGNRFAQLGGIDDVVGRDRIQCRRGRCLVIGRQLHGGQGGGLAGRVLADLDAGRRGHASGRQRAGRRLQGCQVGGPLAIGADRRLIAEVLGLVAVGVDIDGDGATRGAGAGQHRLAGLADGRVRDLQGRVDGGWRVGRGRGGRWGGRGCSACIAAIADVGVAATTTSAATSGRSRHADDGRTPDPVDHGTAQTGDHLFSGRSGGGGAGDGGTACGGRVMQHEGAIGQGADGGRRRRDVDHAAVTGPGQLEVAGGADAAGAVEADQLDGGRCGRTARIAQVIDQDAVVQLLDDGLRRGLAGFLVDQPEDVPRLDGQSGRARSQAGTGDGAMRITGFDNECHEVSADRKSPVWHRRPSVGCPLPVFNLSILTARWLSAVLFPCAGHKHGSPADRQARPCVQSGIRDRAGDETHRVAIRVMAAWPVTACRYRASGIGPGTAESRRA